MSPTAKKARRAGGNPGKRLLRPKKKKLQPGRVAGHLAFLAATPSRCVASRPGAAYEIVTIKRNRHSARIDGPDFESVSREFRRLRDAKAWLESHAAARATHE